MNHIDFIQFSLQSVMAHPLRSILTSLGVAIGVASVILLMAIGEGIKQFTLAEFSQFGTHLLAVAPGKSTTFGISGALFGNIRPLTLEDAAALRRLPGVIGMTPSVLGNIKVEAQGLSRRTNMIGVGPEALDVWQMAVARGEFLPHDNLANARALAVLGARLASDLFPGKNPIGQRLRVGQEGYRVVGVLASKGQFLGLDLDDAVYIPIGRSLIIFDREGVMEIDLWHAASLSSLVFAESVRKELIRRHGQEDFTITTQDEMLSTLGSILDVLTYAVAGLGGVSLLVGGVGIFTIMTIAAAQRSREIGLLSALGATRRMIAWLFMSEAALLGALGGLAGLLLGAMGALLLAVLIPKMPVHISLISLLLAESIALTTGIVSGLLPARNAARHHPVHALRAE